MAKEVTLLSSYSEVNMTHISVEVASLYGYEDFSNGTGGEEPWPSLLYTFYVRRVGGSTWWTLLLMPNILLAFLSSAVSFLRPETGERLSYGITLIVAIEVGRFALVTVLPACGELLAIQLLVTECSIVGYLSLLQTTVVLYLHHHQDESLIPAWLLNDLRRLAKHWQNASADEPHPASGESEWETLKASASPEGVSSWLESCAKIWDSSAAAALFRSGKLFRETGGKFAASDAYHNIRRDFLTPDLKLLWAERIQSLEAELRQARVPRSGLQAPSIISVTTSPPPSPPASSTIARDSTKGTHMNLEPSSTRVPSMKRESSLRRSVGQPNRPPPIAAADDSAHGEPALPSMWRSPRAAVQRQLTRIPTFEKRAESLRSFRARAQTSRSSKRATVSKSPATDVEFDKAFLLRLLFYERIFFSLDVKHVGKVSTPVLGRLMSYLDFHRSLEERNIYLAANTDSGDDGWIDRFEFLEICIDRLWQYDIELLTVAADNFALAQQAILSGANGYWVRCGKCIDRTMGIIVPFVHMTFVVTVLNLKFLDGYNQQSYDTEVEPMQSGWLQPSMPGSALGFSLIIPSIGLLLCILVVAARSEAHKVEECEKEKQRAQATFVHHLTKPDDPGELRDSSLNGRKSVSEWFEMLQERPRLSEGSIGSHFVLRATPVGDDGDDDQDARSTRSMLEQFHSKNVSQCVTSSSRGASGEKCEGAAAAAGPPLECGDVEQSNERELII